MPSLLNLALDKMLQSGCPETREIIILPPHLKDALRRVLLRRGDMTGDQLSALLHRDVRSLDLSDCVLSLQHLVSVSSSCSNIRELTLDQSAHVDLKNEPHDDDDDDDDDECCRAVNKILYRNKFLVQINLRHVNYVSDSNLRFLPRTLSHLDVGGCSRVSDHGVRRISSNCPLLSSLSLSRTSITDTALIHISRGRCRNTLREIRVNGCNISDRGIQVESVKYFLMIKVFYCKALLIPGSSLQIIIFHGCPGVTEQSRLSLSEFLSSEGQRVRQVTWTVY